MKERVSATGVVARNCLQNKIQITITKQVTQEIHFKLSRAEEVGHSSAQTNIPRPQPHAKFKEQKPNKYKTLYVTIKIQSVTVDAVIDTGAQVSIINDKLFQKLNPSPKIKDHVLLKGISKDTVNSKICQNVPFCLGNVKSLWNFAIADIDDSVIIGLDFLEHFKVKINLQNFSLSIGTNTFPAKCVANKDKEKIHIFRVQTKNKVVIPPRSSMYTKIKFDEEPNSDLVISPCHDINGLLSPNCVLKCDQRFILLKNPTDRFISVKRNSDMGIGIPIDQIIESESFESIDSKEQAH